ncbi:MAG: lipoate--protein ligase [Syntrophomonadaceae bacterium]|jgi:lipoate-protein ligase A
MITIMNESVDPYFNMALEEYILSQMPNNQNYFMLWQNRPAVIVGRNQNTVEEINEAFIKEKGIKVVRRLSGGGAVYHDYGNLNFTFVVSGQHYFANFQIFTLPVIRTLERLGVMAENDGRNDILIDGRKFSGNAQYMYKNRLLHHGTILFNSNIENMVKALTPSGAKITSKGIKSVRSRVTNICEHLPNPVGIEEFKQLLTAEVMQQDPDSHCRSLSPEEIAAINHLRNNKYATWDWIYGQSPAYSKKITRSFPWGNLDVRLDIKQGLIKNIRIFGDYFAKKDIALLEKGLVGTMYQKEKIKQQLVELDLQSFLPQSTDDEFADLLTS